MRYLLKVVETGNFTRAAKELHVSQPALGLQIRQLEEDCDLELLSRHSRGITPTAAGRFLYDRAKEILDLVSETQRDLVKYRQTSAEKIRIGLPRSIMRHLGSSLLLDARDTMPDVFLQISEEFNSRLLEAAQRNEIDIGLIYDIDNDRDVVATPILREDIILASKSDDSRWTGSDVRLQDALKCKLIFQQQHSLVKKAVDKAATQYSIVPDIAFEAQSTEAISEAVGCGLAVAIVPYGLMSTAIRSGKVAARRIVEPSISRTLFLVRPVKQQSFKNYENIEIFVARICGRLIESLSEFSEPLGRPAGRVQFRNR